jgi:hypothetical protein
MLHLLLLVMVMVNFVQGGAVAAPHQGATKTKHGLKHDTMGQQQHPARVHGPALEPSPPACPALTALLTMTLCPCPLEPSCLLQQLNLARHMRLLMAPT